MKIRNLFLIIVLVFGFLIVINLVSASGCCLKTKGNQYCVSEKDGGTLSNCGEGLFLNDDCDKVSECSEKGCCFVEGGCNEEVPKIKCTSTQGDFYPGSCNKVSSCSNVCCRVQLGYLYVPQTECDIFGGLVKEDVSDEPSCKALNYGIDQQRVCCSFEGGSCNRTQNSECESNGGIPFPGLYCKDVGTCNPKCETRKSIRPGQIDEEKNKLYWHDSCGNQEDLVDVNDPIDDFKNLGYDKPFNGDCEADPSMSLNIKDSGLFSCSNLVCKKLWDNPFTDENHNGNLKDDNYFEFGGEKRDFRYNGESWCEYMQAKVGPGLDLPGSRHYLHRCERGNERVDSEGQGRNSICVEKIVEKTIKKDNGVTSTVKTTQASWHLNVANACVDCNDPELVKTGKIKECCASNKNCVYTDRVALYQDRVNLFVRQEVFNNLVNARKEAHENLDVKYEKLQYWKDGQLITEEDFNKAVQGFDNPKCAAIKKGEDSKEYRAFRGINTGFTGGLGAINLNEESQYIGLCQLQIFNPPAGVYEVVFTGRACPKIGECESRSYSLGQMTFALEATKGGVCLPLVPPSGDDLCSSFSKYNLQIVSPYTTHNYYYNTAYNSFGLGGKCDGTINCRDVYISEFLKFGAPVGPESVGAFGMEHGVSELDKGLARFVYDDVNSICRGFGDCGYSPSIGGAAVPLPYFTHQADICVYSDGGAGCYRLIDADYGNASSTKYTNLLNGSSVTPNGFNYTYILFLFPLSLFSRRSKFNKKYLLYFLILISIILAGCGNRDLTLGAVPPEAYLNCTQWRPIVGADECWKCNKNWSEGGLLPDINLTDLNGKSSYKCTPELCYSLGMKDSACTFREDKNGAFCVPVTKFQLPTIEFLDANFTCSTDGGDCVSGKTIITNSVTNPSLEIPGKLQANSGLIVKFKTKATVDLNQELPTQCYYSLSSENENGQLKNRESLGWGIEHSLNFVLVTRPETYNVYIQCQNANGKYANLGQVKFTVGKSEDIEQPIIYKTLYKNGNKYTPFNSSAKEVALYVKGNPLECRWSNESIKFENMRNSFFCSKKSDFEYGGSVCETLVKGVNLGDNKYWFSCRNSKGLSSQLYPEQGLEVVGTNALNITDIKCENSLNNDCDKIYDSNFNFSIRTASGAENGNARCRWAADGFSYDSFTEPGYKIIAGKGKNVIVESNYGSIHRKLNFQHGTGLATLRFLCSDIAGNIAEKSISVNIERDESAPKINKVYRYGNELYIQTNEVSKCLYITNLTTTVDKGLELTNKNGVEHSTNIEGNFYRISCQDRFGNKNNMDVYISKLH